MRSPRSACSAVLVALLAAAGLGACGGSDTLSGPEAERKANALCRASAARGQRIINRSDPSRDASFLATIRAQAVEKDRLQSGLHKLSLDGSSRVADYVEAQGEEADAARGFAETVARTRSLRGPSKRRLAAQKRAQDAAVRAAERAGLRDCGPRVREIEAATTPIGRGSVPKGAGNAVIPGSALVGTWEGTAYETSPGKASTTYPVYFRIDPRVKEDGGNGGVRYDALRCIGRVRIYEAGSGREGFGYRYKLRERILVGRDRCGPGGTITAVTEGDELDWRWRRGDVRVAAILRLRDAPKRERVSEDAMRQLQGHDYIGHVTRFGPAGRPSRHQARFGLYPPGSRAGVDGYTQYTDLACVGELTLERAEGDRAVLRQDFPDSDCVSGQRVETRRVGNRVLFRWFQGGPAGGGDSSPGDSLAIGTLEQEIHKGPTRGPAPG